MGNGDFRESKSGNIIKPLAHVSLTYIDAIEIIKFNTN